MGEVMFDVSWSQGMVGHHWQCGSAAKAKAFIAALKGGDMVRNVRLVKYTDNGALETSEDITPSIDRL